MTPPGMAPGESKRQAGSNFSINPIKTVECGGPTTEQFHARAVLLTTPIALLKQNLIEFVPELHEKKSALHGLELGQVFKAVLHFREAFWQSEKFCSQQKLDAGRATGLTYVHSEQQEIPVWWTSAPSLAPILTVWAGGPKAEALLSADEPGRLDKSIESVSKVFGVARRLVEDELEAWWMHGWRTDRHIHTWVSVAKVPRNNWPGQFSEPYFSLAKPRTGLKWAWLPARSAAVNGPPEK